jgi:hypothetical protein
LVVKPETIFFAEWGRQKNKNFTKNTLLPIESLYLPAFTSAPTHDSGFYIQKTSE